MDNILDYRFKTLLKLYEFVEQELTIDREVMDTAAYIFDRYLSTFVPSYIHGKANIPCRPILIGAASLLIAAKSLMPREDIFAVEDFLCDYCGDIYKEEVELKILRSLNWNVIFHSPMSILEDLMTLLPRPVGYHDHDELISAYKVEVRKEAAHLTKLALVYYGFNTNYPPSTIALAALKIALESQPLSTNVAIFNLAKDPIVYFGTMFEQYSLGLSFSDKGVVRCHHELVYLLEDRGAVDKVMRTCGSPSNAAEVPGSV